MPAEISLTSLTHELALVLHDLDQAKLVVRDAGFPVCDIPHVKTSREFWALVVEAAEAGKIVGGAVPLVAGAARLFPDNRIFAEYRASATQHVDEHSIIVPSCDGPLNIPGRETHPFASNSTTIRSERGGIEMVRIPAGTFLMGSPMDEGERDVDEGPQHHVELAEFYLAPTPITNAQYGKYLYANPDTRRPDSWQESAQSHPHHPVVGVSWYEARAYCTWAELQLPTEAQWEYACRAGTRAVYFSGDDRDALARVGWYAENSGIRLHPVGELEPNPWGLYDMHGNASEWCLDASESYDTCPRSGDGSRGTVESAYRVVRGGHFQSGAAETRAAYRRHREPGFRYPWLGFRPARSKRT